MKHFQQNHRCGVCGREFIVDINSIGSPHQWVGAVTCAECAKKVGGNILGDKVEDLLDAQDASAGRGDSIGAREESLSSSP